MKTENYRNFIMKTLLDNGGSMERRDIITKFENKFLHGEGKMYLRPEELVGKEHDDFWYNALGWARSELRVDGLLQKGNPVGLWKLTAEGEEAANQLWPEDTALYLENMQQRIREAITKTTDPEAKRQFISALLRTD